MKTAVYFLTEEAFKSLAYGDTTKAYVLKEKAEIVIIGHTVTKHGLMVKTLYEVSREEIEAMKKDFKGIILLTPCL